MSDQALLQFRTDKADKEAANAILKTLGLNMSTYLNMALKQLIITKSVPFAVSVDDTERKVQNTLSTLRLEDMPLDDAQETWLKKLAGSSKKQQEKMIQEVVSKYKEA